MKPTPKQYQEAVERTKKIKEHLIKEGYAENEESAESIIIILFPPSAIDSEQ